MARPLVPDDLWAAIAPRPPPARPKPKGGRPAVPDRAALTGILFVLEPGLPWEMPPAEMGCGSGMSCWRRLRGWQAGGVWRSEEHTPELQSRQYLVCRLLLDKKTDHVAAR